MATFPFLALMASLVGGYAYSYTNYGWGDQWAGHSRVLYPSLFGT